MVIERLNFQSPKLSKSLNRIISNFGKKIINNKLNQLKEEFGIIVTEINPAYTSQTCSKCNYVDKRNI
ncbi:MAG: zinc ribbon domain-containing protein [Campylobacterota bacterium]|nr:zinc ribbon domain-containing protein [Campylobacterota bacterium]